ncbi:MAG TPA: crosslink repair DNA glycosylase YcaQ family protein [Bryobacteraceae bacterium]|nr:crosslink repair DNA glycosylase YcaQ family protein [Bryobacteraceae bacterium]
MSAAPIEKLRAWWSHRQALDGGLAGKPAADVLQQTGWARSVGGSAPYLTLFARAGTLREAADKAVADLEIHELPAARGCTYVVPGSDFALALKAGESFRGAEMKVAYKLGVTDKEIDKLCDAVAKALARGPLDPDEIREATGKASRSLGEEGKKKGLTTTLPLALGKLQAAGNIRRVPLNGRLDQQRYRYTLWSPNPVAQFKLSPEEVNTELARRYFTWTGPASMAEFQWFSALSGKAAQAAVAPLDLEELADGRLMLPDDREEFEAFQTPKTAQYVLVSSLDGVSLLRRDLSSLADAACLKHSLFAASRGGLVPDLPTHGIFDRGRLVGLWVYDPAAESIVWTAFIAKNNDLREAVAKTELYVRTQLGDVRAGSLDSPKSRPPLIAALSK